MLPPTMQARSFFVLVAVAVLQFACQSRDAAIKNNVEVKCTGAQKITAIYKQYVYDLSGYESSGGGSAFNLFDENSLLDPKNGSGGPATSGPHPLRNADIYFPLNKGSRIVVDLQVPYRIGEIYLYDRSPAADTVWIYTGEMNNWKLKTTLVSKGDPSAWGWRKFSIDDSTRFVQFRFRSYEANFTEAVMYGCPFGNAPPPPPSKYTGQTFARKPLRDFVGVNMFNELPLEWVQPFGWIRMYCEANLFDMDSSNAYPFNRINVSRYGYLYQGNTFRHYSDDLATINTKMWYSMRGVPAWMNRLGLWDKDRPLTAVGLDPEDPMSYGRHAYLMWTLAAVFGKTAVDTNLLNLADMIRVTGKGTMTDWENGNEEDAYWAGPKFCTPMEYFAQSSADYDGHMGKLGPRHGIAAADPGSRLIMSGTVGLDTNRFRVLDFLCRTLRPDKKFLWQGGIQYHHYSTNVGESIAPNRFTKATKGITPEEDSLRQRLVKVRDFTYRLQPGVECILGEYGFDKNPASTQSTPVIPGYSPAQSQGIMLLRSINAVAFSGFDRLILYWMKDQEPESSPYVYLTSGLVYQSMDQKVTPYPSWYHVSTMMHHLGNYVPDAIISEKGQVWVYRYRHQVHRDSVALFTYIPTSKATKIADYNLDVAGASGNVLEISFADKLKTGRSALKPVLNGKVSTEVSAVPKLILYRQAAGY